MVRIILGSGDKRQVYERADKGRAMHEQRRAIKMKLGLLH
jgi:hypothetical protein